MDLRSLPPELDWCKQFKVEDLRRVDLMERRADRYLGLLVRDLTGTKIPAFAIDHAFKPVGIEDFREMDAPQIADNFRLADRLASHIPNSDTEAPPQRIFQAVRGSIYAQEVAGKRVSSEGEAWKDIRRHTDGGELRSLRAHLQLTGSAVDAFALTAGRERAPSSRHLRPAAEVIGENAVVSVGEAGSGTVTAFLSSGPNVLSMHQYVTTSSIGVRHYTTNSIAY